MPLQYVSTYDLCFWTKSWQHFPVDELQLLSILDIWWDMLSIDFMVKLLESSRHDTIMTIIDSVSQRVHFVLTHTTVIAKEAARLFLHYFWKLHSLLRRVVSDRGPQFMVSFMKKLYRLLVI